MDLREKIARAIRANYHTSATCIADAVLAVLREQEPDGVVEALQRIIESTATLGPASREDALLVARHRTGILAAPIPPFDSSAKVPALVAEIARKDAEIAELREKKFARFNGEDCWIFQGDGEDHLESLVCPVVISAHQLSSMFATKAEWRQSAGEAASTWLHQNDPDGLDWCDARNIDAMLDAIPGPPAESLAQARADERERVKQRILGGHFLHDTSPAKQFAHEVAVMIDTME